MMCLAVVALVACETKDVPTGDDPATKPVIILANAEIEVAAQGGDYSVNYNVANAIEGAELSVVESAEWITDVTVEAGVITFTVAANNEEAERTATISIEYPDAVAKSLAVKQLGNVVAFVIDVQEVHAASAITKVTPKNGEMFYVMYLEEVSYFQNGGITTPEQLWDDDLLAFENNAAGNSMKLKDYMQAVQVLFQGTQRVQWNRVLPGIKSVLYVYGVQFSEDGSSYEPVTDIYWEVIEPEYAPLQEVNFDLSVEVDGANVELSVKPENWDGYYLVKIVDGNDELYLGNDATITDDFMKSISDEWLATCSSNLRAGHSIDDILETIAFKGEELIATELTSYTLYTALAFPIAEYDGYYQVVGKPSYINFSTEEVQQSDLDINIEVSNCYVRVADLKITPSNPEESYMLLITPTEYLPKDYDDQTLLDMALGEFIYYTYNFKGEITTHLNTLYPNKEYIVVAFGYSGGVVTTEVCTKIFKTEPEGECLLEITDVVFSGPYRPGDLYNYNPDLYSNFIPMYNPESSMGVIAMEVKTSEPTSDIFTYACTKMDYDWGGYDTTFYDLLIDTCPPVAVSIIIYDYMPYYVCAAAFDYKGNVTPMWMSEPINWTSEDIRPISELIEKLESGAQVQMLSVQPMK
ncbi:MAG: BACON domain-containing protein [Alistipes sp.]|nr:BACON domain-containing protein [Alistipes sp.]